MKIQFDFWNNNLKTAAAPVSLQANQMKIVYTIGIVLSLFLLILGCSLSPSSSTEKEQPTPLPDSLKCAGCNVILISLDTLRADHLGAYGYPRNTSPNIDALADQSIVFNNFFANGFFSLPVHMSLFTGTYPLKHRILYPSHVPQYRETNQLNPEILTITEIFKRNSYSTIWTAEDTHYLDLHRGFERGFDAVYGPVFSKPLKQNQEAFRQQIFDSAVLSMNQTRFFWFFHTYAIHAPYITPEPFQSAFINHEYSGPFPDTLEDMWKIQMEKLDVALEQNKTFVMQQLGVNESEIQHLIGILDANDTVSFQNFKPILNDNIEGAIGFGGTFFYGTNPKNSSLEDVQQAVDTYDGGILFVDHLLGIFFDQIKERGLWNNTIIIVISDHGEELFDHGDFGHKNFYDHTIHVPLIIHVPGMDGRVDVQNLIQSADLLPTVLSIVEIDSPQNIDGQDQIAVLRGDADPTQATYGISFGKMYIRTKEWKYILNANGSEELYDLLLDPFERENLAKNQSFGDVRDNLRRLLDVWSSDSGS